MRTLFTVAASMVALLLGGAAIAGSSDGALTNVTLPDTAADAADTALAQARTAAAQRHAAAQEDAELEDDGQQEDAAAAEKGDAAIAQVNEDAFGPIRAAEVQAAIEAGDTPDPAWMNPAHPTGGPEAARQSTTKAKAEAEDDDDAVVKAEDADDADDAEDGDDAADDSDDDDDAATADTAEARADTAAAHRQNTRTKGGRGNR